jgi:hypothetical protein
MLWSRLGEHACSGNESARQGRRCLTARCIVKEYPVYNFKTELRLRLLF